MVILAGIFGLILIVLLMHTLAHWQYRQASRTVSVIAILQFQLPALGLPPAALLSGVAGGPTFWRLRHFFAHPLVACTSAIAVIQSFALLWSTDIERGIRDISYAVLFLYCLLIFMQTARESEHFLLDLWRPMSAIIFAQSVATVAFRLSPSAERAYLQSVAGFTLLGNAASNVYDSEPNNVVLTYKSGGLLFVNANVNSLFLGCSALLGFCILRKYGSRVALWVMSVSVVATIAAGSKTGIILLVAIPLLLTVIRVVRFSAYRTVVVMLGLVVLPIAIVAVWSLLQRFLGGQIDDVSGRVDDPAQMLDARFQIWSPLPTLFSENPVLGLGFGGWQQRFTDFVHLGTEGGAYPPHNLLIAAWASAGVFNLLAIGAFFFIAVTLCLRALWATEGADADVSGCALGVVLWILVHGQADNTWFFGALPTIPLLAVLLAFVSEQSLRSQKIYPSIDADRGSARRGASLGC